MLANIGKQYRENGVNTNGKTMKDKVKSELIIKTTGVEPLKEILRSQNLRCSGHVQRMNKEKATALAMKIIKDKKEDLKNDGWRLLRKT